MYELLPSSLEQGLTVDEYYKFVLLLGLRPTNVPVVFRTRQGEAVRVPDPSLHSPAQRRETIENIIKIIECP